jgi:hypothetical protein
MIQLCPDSPVGSNVTAKLNDVLYAQGDRNKLFVCPASFRSPFSSLDLAPQGHAGNDDLTATGDDNELKVCPASALTTAVDLASFAGQRGRRQADRDGLRPCPRRRAL